MSKENATPKAKAKPFQNRGRSGREGKALKFFGMLGAAVGLVWLVLVYVIWDLGSGMVVPLCLMVVGVAVFWVGRGIARSSGGGRG